jgi:hypothetical protein
MRVCKIAFVVILSMLTWGIHHDKCLPFCAGNVKTTKNSLGDLYAGRPSKKGDNMGHHQHEDEHNEHESVKEMPFVEKARKLVDHWIQHNQDHAGSYMQWAQEFKKNDLEVAATLLESVCELTNQINLMLRDAARQIPSKTS